MDETVEPSRSGSGPYAPLQRIPTGIAGLDIVLHGGFLRGGLYFIMGEPGTGKTILANQICFHHVAAGGRVVYLTLLAETHDRMFAHLSTLSFFTHQPIGDPLYYISGYSVLESDGLNGLSKLLQEIILSRGATVLVIDGMVIPESATEQATSFREFLHRLQVFIQASGCTTFILSPRHGGHIEPGETIADGLVELARNRVRLRLIRELEIKKLRGSAFLEGGHLFEIGNDGLRIFPRTEARFSSPPEVAVEHRKRMEFGITKLDHMLYGGILSGTTTMLLGPSGSGKTLHGLHFLAAGARQSEPGLYFGFYETPPRLIEKANQIGLDFGSLVADGQIEVLWQPPLEEMIDALADRLLNAAHTRQVKRLVIDGLEAFVRITIYPERISHFFAALTNELRARNVTTLFSMEVDRLFGSDIIVPVRGISDITDNIMLLRYVELRSQLYRLISVLKLRESGYDTSIREFKISDRGIEVAETFESAEAILTGLARPTQVEPADR